MRELRNTEVVITEKKQDNSADSNISLDNIYKALGYLKSEEQGILLSTYKLTELYSICANNEGYRQYIRDLFNYANETINKAGALISLHTEAFKQSLGKPEETNMVDSMGKVYDRLPEEDRKKFCEEILQKKEFFQDAYKVMMGVFENAVKSNETTEKDTAKE